jgi:hydrogenase expression/formation protein HypD
MLRVPAACGKSLADAQETGADARVVYSPMDAVRLAESLPEKNIILSGCGFETTAPLIGACVKAAEAKKLKNFFVYVSLKLITPAIEALLKEKNKIDAFILPGHVSLVTGFKPYGFIAEKFHKPGVIAGFEEAEILAALNKILRQLAVGEARIDNAYALVKTNGQPEALRIMKEVFLSADGEWRGLGKIKKSALILNKKYARYDAEKKFKPPLPPAAKNKGCLCGEVLKGNAAPRKCGLFGKKCLPQSPFGPCMVSEEGACRAAYEYER